MRHVGCRLFASPIRFVVVAGLLLGPLACDKHSQSTNAASKPPQGTSPQGGKSDAQLKIADALRDGDVGKLKALLKDNPEVVFSRDGYAMTPLLLAAVDGRKDMAELLLASKAEVNAKNKE